MAKRHLVKLGWQSDSQSSKKLGTSGLGVKPSDIGLELSGGGRAPIFFNVDAVLRIVLRATPLPPDPPSEPTGTVQVVF